jgi:hypothetical protein
MAMIPILARERAREREKGKNEKMIDQLIDRHQND